MINKNYFIYIWVFIWLDKLMNFSDIENEFFFLKLFGDMFCIYIKYIYVVFVIYLIVFYLIELYVYMCCIFEEV